MQVWPCIGSCLTGKECGHQLATQRLRSSEHCPSASLAGHQDAGGLGSAGKIPRKVDEASRAKLFPLESTLGLVLLAENRAGRGPLSKQEAIPPGEQFYTDSPIEPG